MGKDELTNLSPQPSGDKKGKTTRLPDPPDLRNAHRSPRFRDISAFPLRKLAPWCAVCTKKFGEKTKVEEVRLEHTTDIISMRPEREVEISVFCHGKWQTVVIPYLVAINPEVDVEPMWAFVESALPGEQKRLPKPQEQIDDDR